MSLFYDSMNVWEFPNRLFNTNHFSRSHRKLRSEANEGFYYHHCSAVSKKQQSLVICAINWNFRNLAHKHFIAFQF